MTSFRYVPFEDSGSDKQVNNHQIGPLIAAFQTLDTNRQGFFPKDILLHILTTKGDRKLDPELVELILDKVSLGGRVYYKDICELFKETSLLAESVMNDKQKKELKSVEPIEEDTKLPGTAEDEHCDILQESKQTTISETSDSSPSLGQSSIATPTQRPDSASPEPTNIPTVTLPNSETIDEPTSIEAASEIQDYDLIINATPDEATIDSVEGSQENIPELLKLSSPSQN
ncbi:hypothetical protein LOD99_4652 [Oopsacas minuta]|uniref:EF-hand domain-containing protein n=1 Tax=Oopsacas minuta TaxID=111878 RepID=A0AAV7JTM3_9METZ|nr:hypothetical protein LOD99_4652 [Oopsacas minuta]